MARPALAMRFVDPADPATDTQRFGDWLAAHGQSERARRALWDLFSVSALNIAGDDASLALAATVVKTGLLGKNNAADIGVAALPLGELHGDAGAALLAKLGARVPWAPRSPGSRSPRAPDARFRVRLAPGRADPGRATRWSWPSRTRRPRPLVPPDAAAGPGPSRAWAGLGASPIVNVHVIYDRPVTDLPFAAAIDSPVQWVFDRTRISGLATPGQYLAISLSAADAYVDVPAARLREQFVPALAELFPAARDAQVTEFFVTRERRATFRQAPGSGALRPGPRPDATRPGAGRGVDRHRMAGHDGGRGAQRPGRALASCADAWPPIRAVRFTSTMGVRQ